MSAGMGIDNGHYTGNLHCRGYYIEHVQCASTVSGSISSLEMLPHMYMYFLEMWEEDTCRS